ncbi:MAG: hypothetical protein IV086_15425 [Hyphomonadaceae bacterium]|nr:hypothetical protein [Hyphomonadaceae bacterium]
MSVLTCSWCGGGPNDYRKIIAGPGTLICDQCVLRCLTVIADDKNWLDRAISDALLKHAEIDLIVSHRRSADETDPLS